MIILTKNEERDLPGCLDSLTWCDDMHVVDSGSTDGTRDLVAARPGISLREHPFESFGAQRNWALEHCAPAHPWVLFLDADERTPPAFVEAMAGAVSRAPVDVAGYYCCWKLLLNDRWLRRSDNFPKWQFRLLRVGRASFADFGHGQKEGEVLGRLDYLREPYLHSPFSRGWEHWTEKHRRYAEQEAVARRRTRLCWKDLFSSHGSKRNPALKVLLSRLPFWPTIRFFVTYVLSGGFLEGREGWIYCSKIRWYEAEIQRRMRAIG